MRKKRWTPHERSQLPEDLAAEAQERKEQAKSDMRAARNAGDSAAAAKASEKGRRMGNIAKRFGGSGK